MVGQVQGEGSKTHANDELVSADTLRTYVYTKKKLAYQETMDKLSK